MQQVGFALLMVLGFSWIALTQQKEVTVKISPDGYSTSIVNVDKTTKKEVEAKAEAEKIKAAYVIADFNKANDYVERFAKTAQQEQEIYNIPASITLAQGILESSMGESKLATQNNNHFGIKCFSKSCQKGHCSNYGDDSHKDFFLKFNSAWESYRKHSKFLQGKRYKHLQKYGTDYVKWSHGLHKAGYATDPNYGYKLISIIEQLKLNEYDK